MTYVFRGCSWLMELREKPILFRMTSVHEQGAIKTVSFRPAQDGVMTQCIRKVESV